MKGRTLCYVHRTIVVVLLGVFLLSGCAQDQYQLRADVIKDHVENFYTHLKSNRVSAAIHENEQIEAMADQMAAPIGTR